MWGAHASLQTALAPWGGWRAIAGLAVAACALWLVYGFDYDHTVDRKTDDDYCWLYPRLNKAISAVKQFASLAFLSVLLAAVALAVWNQWAPRLGLPPAADLSAHFDHWRLPPADHTYWRAVALSALVVTLLKARRASRTPRYDLFVSYRSTDAHVVRQVADALIAAGGRVWFAEYEVLIRGREGFQKAIDDGLRRAARVLAFTGDHYAASGHCRGELERFLSRASPTRVVEVRTDGGAETRRRFPSLRESVGLSSRDPSEILGFLRERYGWPVEAPAKTAGGPPRVFEAECLGRRFRLDVTGWAQHAAAGREGESPTFRREAGGRQMFVNLVWGPDVSEEASRRRRAGADDREMYDMLMEYVGSRHLEGVGGRVRGVHLLFHGGLSQMCVTYWTRGYWTRKCSVVLPHPDGRGAPAEFVFTFGFDGSFRDYCRHAHLTDELVLSLAWR